MTHPTVYRYLITVAAVLVQHTLVVHYVHFQFEYMNNECTCTCTCRVTKLANLK